MAWPKFLIREVIKEVPSTKTVQVEVPCDCHKKITEVYNDLGNTQKELARLLKEKTKAVEDLEKVKLEHKMTLEDIKHMQKMLDEKNALELDRKIFEGEKKAEEEIKAIRKEYSDKLEKELMEERKKMQEFMQKVMEALPNVNVRIKGS